MTRFLLPREFLSQTNEAASLRDAAFFDLPHGDLPEGYIHLDYAAATPLDTEVFRAMAPWLFAWFGNPSATVHGMGAKAYQGLCEARQTCADIVGVEFEEILFTASATESNNLFIRSLTPRQGRNRILYGATEHSSIAVTVERMASMGFQTEKLPVDENGQVRLDEARQLIDEKTLAVCLMDVNNETGILQGSLGEVVVHAHSRGALVHVDAVQGFARGSFSTKALDWDSLTVSAGKIYGPRGAALLAVRRKSRPIRLLPQLTGGGHEFGLRSSTSNVAGAVGLANAMAITENNRAENNAHLAHLTQIFETEILSRTPALIHGSGAPRAPGITMLAIPGINPIKLLEVAHRIAFGLGSACKTGSTTASSVLLEMGVPPDTAMASFRVSFGRPSSEDDAREGAWLIGEAVKKTPSF